MADRGLRDRLATAQARYLLLDGRGGEALGIASAVLAHEPADEETRARATTMAAWALVQAGRANQAVATIAQQGYLGAESGKERPWLSDVDWVLCAAYVILGRFAEAETIAAAAYQRVGFQPLGLGHMGLGVHPDDRRACSRPCPHGREVGARRLRPDLRGRGRNRPPL